jgi:anti-sigma regulatory factor (Ser/Thr protein kinase)
VGGFVRAALSRDEAVLVAVPGRRIGLLRDYLDGAARRVMFTDMARLGRNPARIMSAVQNLLGRHPGQRVSYVGEPIWPGRGQPELQEAIRHEAMINLACANLPADILCPYDETGLPADVMAGAARTHPVLARPDGSRASGGYLGAGQIPADCQRPLPAPPPSAVRLDYACDLRPVRALVASRAAAAGLAERRRPDLVLAVSEVAANTLAHAGGHGTLHVWQEAGEIVCQLDDGGWISDPLAGRLRPGPGETGGQGLWVVNQVCDLVEVRTGRSGTTIRLRMSLTC